MKAASKDAALAEIWPALERSDAACQRAMEREVRRLGSCAQLQERTERVLKAFQTQG